MLTGDNRRTAAAVAKSLGLDAVEAEVEPAGKVAHVKISAGVYLRSDAEITGDHFDRARQQGLGPGGNLVEGHLASQFQSTVLGRKRPAKAYCLCDPAESGRVCAAYGEA